MWFRTRLAAAIVSCLTLTAATPVVSQTPSPEPPAVRVGGNIPPPQKTKDVKPIYPAAAMASGAQGVVIIEATIGTTGKVRDAVVRRSIPLLDQAALDAVKQWEYTPTVVDGTARPVAMTVSVNFALQSAPTPGMMYVWQQRAPDGTQYYWEISQQRGDALPPWNPAIAPLPLSITDATKAGESWLKQQNPEVKSFDMASVSLSRMQSYLWPDRWFYRVEFDPVVAGRRLAGAGNFIAVVLLDGSILEPRVDKR